MLPIKKTKPVSLHFKTEERALTKKPEIETKSKEESFLQFKAKEAPDFSKLFFSVKAQNDKKPIEFLEFAFETSQRAEKRNEYENGLKQRKKMEEQREKY